jgi:energy-coupling factor transporter ATP-binding protein EcfA2
MQPRSITVQHFRNFVEAQTFDVESDVTVLVGKNESGKTTILKALHRLNPANQIDVAFELTTEYPRWRLARDRKKDPDLASTRPIEATFELTDEDREALAEVMPAPLPKGTTCTASRAYDGSPSVVPRATLEVILRKAAETADLTSSDLKPLLKAGTLKEAASQARAAAKELKDDPDTALRANALAAFATAVSKYMFLRTTPSGLEEETRDALWARMPKFLYFSDYEKLPGECDLTALATKAANAEELTAQETTVIALLAHAGEAPQDFLDDNYDSRKAELQAASLDLSRHVFKYWTQNTDLSVIFDTDNISVGQEPNGGEIMHRFLKIELRDARHGDVETNFATRSAGFQWFFSFFAAFSAYQESDESIVVLLDEPGTSLHGEAQRDFVRFVSAELAESKQTLYTTHSQFLVDPGHYEKRGPGPRG